MCQEITNLARQITKDTTGDGKYDMRLEDTTGDHKYDFEMKDTNADGHFNEVRKDTTADGESALASGGRKAFNVAV